MTEAPLPGKQCSRAKVPCSQDQLYCTMQYLLQLQIDINNNNRRHKLSQDTTKTLCPVKHLTVLIAIIDINEYTHVKKVPKTTCLDINIGLHLLTFIYLYLILAKFSQTPYS